jgi:hypothetical protein
MERRVLIKENNNPYSIGVEYLMESGVAKPARDLVLLRAILKEDGATVEVVGTDTLNAVCHEIVAKGPFVSDEIKIGDHCIHISAAGDAADFLNPNARFTTVRESHITLTWNPKDAQAEFLKLKAKNSEAKLESDVVRVAGLPAWLTEAGR